MRQLIGRAAARWTRPLPLEQDRARQARFGRPFLEPADTYPFLAPVVQAWADVAAEYRAIAERAQRHHDDRHLHGGRWDFYMLWCYGLRVPEHCRACPRTAALAAAVPGLSTAGFSVLQPGTDLRPHRGFPRGMLRLHVALDAPDEGAGLQVGDAVHHWRTGGSVVFDDTFTHRAWNRGERSRAVLLVDFERPDLPPRPDERLWEGIDRWGYRLGELRRR
jgi:aspartyl/asparaginyl beta-hydroxylase (cupin superfamily)